MSAYTARTSVTSALPNSFGGSADVHDPRRRRSAAANAPDASAGTPLAVSRAQPFVVAWEGAENAPVVVDSGGGPSGTLRIQTEDYEQSTTSDWSTTFAVYVYATTRSGAPPPGLLTLE
jgi:hypothetical protein